MFVIPVIDFFLKLTTTGKLFGFTICIFKEELHEIILIILNKLLRLYFVNTKKYLQTVCLLYFKTNYNFLQVTKLGAPLCFEHKCPSGKEVDSFGLYCLSCNKS